CAPLRRSCSLSHFLVHATAPTEIYTLSLHDALPISHRVRRRRDGRHAATNSRGASLMLSLPPTVRVFVAVEPLDMRGSFDALAGAVRRLGLDPVDGHLYLFLNKRRKIAKALWFDGSGWCVLAKRLEAGSFQLPPFDGSKPQVAIDGAA